MVCIKYCTEYVFMSEFNCIILGLIPTYICIRILDGSSRINITHMYSICLEIATNWYYALLTLVIYCSIFKFEI